MCNTENLFLVLCLTLHTFSQTLSLMSKVPDAFIGIDNCTCLIIMISLESSWMRSSFWRFCVSPRLIYRFTWLGRLVRQKYSWGLGRWLLWMQREQRCLATLPELFRCKLERLLHARSLLHYVKLLYMCNHFLEVLSWTVSEIPHAHFFCLFLFLKYFLT